MSSINETMRNNSSSSRIFDDDWAGVLVVFRRFFKILGPIAWAIDLSAVLSFTNTLPVFALKPHVVECTNSHISFRTSNLDLGTNSLTKNETIYLCESLCSVDSRAAMNWSNNFVVNKQSLKRSKPSKRSLAYSFCFGFDCCCCIS